MSSIDSKKSSNKNLLIAAGIAILALLGLNIFMYTSNNALKSDNTVLAKETEEKAAAYEELELNFNEANAQLDEMKTNNTELNAMIDEQKEKLAAQKKKISRLIRNGRNLKKAKAEIEKMNAQLAQYVNEINELKAQNAQLVSANEGLTQEKAMLTSKVEEATAANESLKTAKSALETEKEKLSSTNEVLSRKVTAASAIKAVAIDVRPVKIRKSGKEVKKRYARSIDKVNVCFTADANRVTDGGTESFYVRIINPMGETLAIESLGSGTLTSSDTGDEIRFTKKVEVQYDNKAQNDICVGWNPGTDFMKGVYEVEIYNKGYVTGRTSFKLK